MQRRGKIESVLIPTHIGEGGISVTSDYRKREGEDATSITNILLRKVIIFAKIMSQDDISITIRISSLVSEQTRDIIVEPIGIANFNSVRNENRGEKASDESRRSRKAMKEGVERRCVWIIPAVKKREIEIRTGQADCCDRSFELL